MFNVKKKKLEDIPILNIFQAAVEEVRSISFMTRSIRFKDRKLIIEGEEYDLKRFKKIYLAASGKAAIDMAKSMTALYPGKFSGNLVVSNHYGARFTRLKIMEGGHPYPTRRSFACGKAMVRLFESMEMNDFFIYLLSGGSSSLMEMTYGGVNYDMWHDVTEMLQKEGLSIFELNVLRKKLSRIKGGNLGRMTSAHGVVLIVSDVPDNDFATIGSAPFYPSEPEMETIKKIILKYELVDKLPKNILTELIRERPKQVHTGYPHYILAHNKMALVGAVRKAKAMNYTCIIVDEKVRGEAREYGHHVAKVAKSYESANQPTCLVFGGETTVKVRGTGLGGRNQELVLSAMAELKNSRNISILSAGTDGIDGPTPMAGAYFTPEILDAWQESGLSIDEFLENNDSFHFFKKLKQGHIETGHTGTNVGDVIIALIDPRSEG